MLPVTSKDWAISGRSTVVSNFNYGAMHAVNAHLSTGGRPLSLMCAVKTEDHCFRYTEVMCVQYQCWSLSIFSDTDTESILAVSADTEYPMPVSVSP